MQNTKMYRTQCAIEVDILFLRNEKMIGTDWSANVDK